MPNKLIHKWIFCARMTGGSAYYTCEDCPMSHTIKNGKTTYYYNHKETNAE